MTDHAQKRAPLHLRWEYVLLVLAGGSIGTAARYLVSAAIPPWQGLPIGTFVINVTGAFSLGLLLEALIRRGPDAGSRRVLRLLVGTGMLGGFTTYSSLTVDAITLFAADRVGPALLYAVGTLLIGGLATTAGIVAAAAHQRRGQR